MRSQRVAVVTGANKGIGFQVVKILCEKFDGDVFLCSRNQGRGEHAVEELRKIGLNPYFFKLDIGDRGDVQQLKKKLHAEYGGIDLLINNAAINFVPREDKTPEENIKSQVDTVNTNYFATAWLCDDIFPMMKSGSRVVNVSSSAGMLSFLKNEAITAELSSASLTRARLDEIALQYINDLQNGTDNENGWPLRGYAYFSSKILLSALTWVQQRDMAEKNVAVFAAHPGYVQTDMTAGMGDLTPEQGAESIIFAALEAQPGDEYKRKIIFPSNEPRDWLCDNVFQNGMSVDHVLEFMVAWMKKMAQLPPSNE